MRSAVRLGLVLALATLLLARPTEADELRPYDAPLTAPDAGRAPPSEPGTAEAARARVPPLPEEYLTENEGWIRFAYHPSARDRVRPLLGRASAIRAELRAILGGGVLESVEVRVAAVPGEIARLSPAEPPSYATAAAYSDHRLVVMSLLAPLSGEPPDLEEWLRHELAHLALDDALAAHHVPRWLHEGFAVHFSGESATQRVETLCVATLRDRLVALGELESALPPVAPETSVAYAESASFLRFLLERTPRARFTELLTRVRGGETFESALPAAYGAPMAAVELAFRKDTARRYGFGPVLGGATALGLAVAAGVLVRRLRRKRRLATRRANKDLGRGRTTPLPPRPEDLAEEVLAERGFMPPPVHPDAEVPRIEHGGRWHTLH